MDKLGDYFWDENNPNHPDFDKFVIDKWIQENEKWISHKEYLNKIKMNNREPFENDEYDYYPCSCPCHSNPGMMHIVACCDNGWIKVRKPKKEE